MSGDVQPRKRKDKKKKKDELSLDEPRGTAAALGEGDLFIHSYNYHGTGGHWCAKIIFFSLLAILITLIGLIILENRGLSELEANSVESRYSGILEGWIEDAPDDDHHDEHTLELKHHDENDDEHNGFDEEDDDDDLIDDNEDDGHQDLDDENDEDEKGADEQDDDDDDQDRDNDDGDDDNYRNDDEDRDIEGQHDDQDSQDLDETDNEDEDEHDDDDDDDHDELEVEKIEKEASEEDQEPILNDLPALPEEDDDGKDADDDGHEDDEDVEKIEKEASDDDEKYDDDDDDKESQADDNDDDNDSRGDDDFLEADDEPPVVERITAPAGKPYHELEEEEDSTEKPPDTLEQEEEYEKQQEELRKEQEQSSNMWLKLSVGGALLLATHFVLRRGTALRGEAEGNHESREATPVDRRMTLIPEAEEETPVVPKKVEESQKSATMKQAPVFKAPPPPPIQTQDSEELEELEDEELEEQELEEDEPEEIEQEDEDEKAELYSDDDDEIKNEICIPQSFVPKPLKPVLKQTELPKSVPKYVEPPKPESESEPEPEEEDPEDVEIIEDEQLEEEFSEEEEEEEISDVDDAELLSRLEAKYGRIPDPEPVVPKRRNKDGGNSVNDIWPGEPADAYWRQQLDTAEQELHQGSWWAATKRASAPELQRSARALYISAAALDRLAEAQRDNRLLSRAIAAYLEVLKMSENLPDKKLLDVAERTLDRIRFRGNYLNAEPVYRLLIRRFPDEPGFRNNLTISYLMANRPDLAEGVLQETLKIWPNDKVALAHYGFVLKVNNNKLEEAIAMFEKALKGDEGPACEPRFYYHYGDALLLLGRFKEANEVHKRAAKLGHFLSPSQRSLYNVPRLKSKPWWNVEETPYVRLARALERSWKDILKEGEAAKALYEREKEGLKERGEWSQMDLFVRGMEIPKRCEKAPVTCSIVKSEIAAAGCRRGQVKFSAMEAGTHVRPHVGPTNCRLRMHLGLSNTRNTYIRVDQETRQWAEGKVLMFDDSFEHEVWHNGTGKRMVLIVDVWHPDLTPQERRTLPAI